MRLLARTMWAMIYYTVVRVGRSGSCQQRGLDGPKFDYYIISEARLRWRGRGPAKSHHGACCMSATQTQTDPPTPTWPSLYDPLIEFHDLEHHTPIQPGGRYLTHAGGLTCALSTRYCAAD